MSEENFLVINGNYMAEDSAVLKANNRAFQYADGVFETIRVINGRPWQVKAHFDRLMAGVAAMKMEVPEYFREERIQFHFDQLCEKNGITEGGKIKLMVYRNPGGSFFPQDNGVSYLITARTIENNLFKINEEGHSLEVYNELKKPINFLSNFKLLHSELYVLASLSARENGFTDAIILNENGAMSETTSSNMFLVYPNNIIFTPGLSEGCLAGTMRMHVINVAIQNGFKVYESTINHAKMMEAEEVFITNAISGIQWVVRYKNKRYFHKKSSELLEKLNQYALDFNKE